MSDMLHITAVEPVAYGVLRLRWDDGYEAVVDLRSLIAEGAVFEHIRDPANFAQVRLERYGHHVYWGEEGEEIVDLGCDGLRDLAEEQAASAGGTG